MKEFIFIPAKKPVIPQMWVKNKNYNPLGLLALSLNSVLKLMIVFIIELQNSNSCFSCKHILIKKFPWQTKTALPLLAIHTKDNYGLKLCVAGFFEIFYPRR